MTKRERTLAFLLLPPLLLAGGGFMAYQLWYEPLRARDARIVELRRDIDEKRATLVKAQDRKKDLDAFRTISLPRDIDLARLKYEEELSKIIRDSGFDTGSITIQSKQPDTKTSPIVVKGQPPVYTRLGYLVQVRGQLLSLVEFMEKFYKIQLLHQIRNLKIQRLSGSNANRTNDLDFTMTIEALVLEKADPRKTLLPEKPVEMASLLADGERKYDSIAGRDMFFGPAPPAESEEKKVSKIDFTQFVKFNGYSDQVYTLYDEYNNYEIAVIPRVLGDGFKVEVSYIVNGRKRSLRSGRTLDLIDEYGELQRRFVIVKAAQRELFLQDDESYYLLRLGLRLSEMQKLTAEEAAAHGLIPEKAAAVKDKGE